MSGPSPRWLPDSSSVINLLRDGVKTRALTDLCRRNEMRVVDAVARELQGLDGRAKAWVNANAAFHLAPVDAVLKEVARISVGYRSMFTVTASAADPVLVATACYHRASNTPWVVVSDDGGVQAVCFLEGLSFLTFGAFRKVVGI
jgi:hypothetical protein